MKTVAEILKETGLTDEQIAALDPKVTAGLTQVVSTAQQTLDQAELAKRATFEKYDTEIAPALDAWGNEKAQLEAKASYYKTLAEKAKEGGFLPGDTPFTPPTATATPGRTADGKFVAGNTQVPGSPEFVANLRNEAGAAIGTMLDLSWKYQQLYGHPMPDSPTVIIREAQAQRLDPVTYAAKKYDFAAKETALKAEEQKKHDDAIRADENAKVTKDLTEKLSSNPMIRQAEASGFATLDRAVKANERKSPLGMSREERHQQTQQHIQKDIASNATVN